jgi:uracil-DNA glycosylase
MIPERFFNFACIQNFMGIEDLGENISSCTLCTLSSTRINAVPGEGPKNARIVLVGEAPGTEEDMTGRPFVGRCGKLLDRALEEAGIDRSQVFITSVVKCRPPKNRPPKRQEILACGPYIQKQIEMIKPSGVGLMGNVATKAVLGISGVTSIHGNVYQGKYLVTFHPAAVLRNKNLKEAFVSDLKKLYELANRQQTASSP